ncbi:MAG TPA: enoyl-ACP reductase FabI [Acidimicrobiales bacterium]|nr:enoyl-ACP reductase FabI [Acidimicrobiales bacterium]
MLLEGKKLLITGVLTDDSIAFGVARLAQEQGAEIALTSFGRVMRLTERVARKLPVPDVEILELDVQDRTHVPALTAALETKWGRLDGVLHAIANANPATCLGGDILKADWSDVGAAIEISAYSLKAVVDACLPLLKAAGGGSVVGLDFDAAVAWPVYDWMGVAKAALESTSRYLARDLGPLGIRVNLVAAGPLRTMSAKSIPGFDQFEETWTSRAPLGWDLRDTAPVAKACVALFSDWFPATTGEIIHVDGGVHAVGA